MQRIWESVIKCWKSELLIHVNDDDVHGDDDDQNEFVVRVDGVYDDDDDYDDHDDHGEA